MAKITITGDAMVVTSAVKLADLELIKKYRPQALCLKEKAEDGSTQTVFVVSTSTAGSINLNGVSFNGESREGGKLATITQQIPEGVEDAKAYAAEKIGVAINHLNKLEATIPDTLEAIRAEQAKVMESISLI